MSICIQVLVETDVCATARLVLLDFPLDLAEVAYKLQGNPAEQFNFLQGIFDPKFVPNYPLYYPMEVLTIVCTIF